MKPTCRPLRTGTVELVEARERRNGYSRFIHFDSAQGENDNSQERERRVLPTLLCRDLMRCYAAAVTRFGKIIPPHVSPKSRQ